MFSTILKFSVHEIERVSLSVLSDSLLSHGLQALGSSCPWDFPGKNTRAGCHFLLQRIFLTQGFNTCLHMFNRYSTLPVDSLPSETPREAIIGVIINENHILPLKRKYSIINLSFHLPQLTFYIYSQSMQSVENRVKLKMKITASGPITSWEIDGETVSEFIFGGLQNPCRW